MPSLNGTDASHAGNIITTGRVTGTVSLLLRLEGGVELGAAILAYALLSGGWLMFVVLLLVPDLSMLGYLAGNRVGAALYNVAHTYLAPAVLALLAWALHLPPWVTLAALIWAAHIGMDRLLGFGLKYPEGFKATHLG
jgi:hypothetical protein